ncbi:MAG: alpha/beta hydrolase [Alphaproteobacteria bacterium]|jgi:pimeloyl-ACP methyl ester carboxylesterase|nr:alpha/beta hydrolase [Alphaproteobacteria bacterium]
MREHMVPFLGPHGFNRVACFEWGDPKNERVLICVHGLTRRGRDFDFLAQAVADRYRVICPDMPGRGLSDWLTDKNDYDYITYVSAAAAVIAHSGAQQVDWVGTSMGGLIGMMVAAQPNAPIRKMVINDVGPFLPKAALERIGSYVGTDPRYGSFEELEQALRTNSAPFGPLTDTQWRFLSEHYAKRLTDGGWTSHYDPGIAVNIRKVQPAQDVALWPVWDQVKCPVLVLRGAQSDLLTAETAKKMQQRSQPTDVVEIAGVGHAPALLDDRQISIVRTWLYGT